MSAGNNIFVNNTAELRKALADATGGETIILRDGRYDSVEIKSNYSSMVTITAENTHSAQLSGLKLTGASNVTLDGLKTTGMVYARDGAYDLVYTNNLFDAGIYFKDADDIVVDSNEIANSYNVATFNDVTNFRLTNNYLHDAESDMLRVTGSSKYGVIENNTLYDIAAERPDHPDMMQFFAVNGQTPTDMTIRGNLIYDDPKTGSVYAQGIFLGTSTGKGFTDFLIEDNLITVGSPNSIYVNGGQENVLIQNNTLIPWPTDGGAIIRLAERGGYDNSGTIVRDNIAKAVMDETGESRVDGNYFYGRNADLGRIFSGDGSSWSDYQAPSNSPIGTDSKLGAYNRLLELSGTPREQRAEVQVDPAPVRQAPVERAPVVQQSNLDEIPSSDDVIKVANASDVIEVAPGALPGYAAASLSFGFTADDTGRLQGLVSNDATGFGNHFNAYLQDGKLNVRFQTDEGGEVILSKSGIVAGQDYDVNITTNGDMVALIVNGVEVDEAKIAWSWADTDQYLQIGANGWASRDGSSGYDGVFKGTISDFAFNEIATTEPAPVKPDTMPAPAPTPVTPAPVQAPAVQESNSDEIPSVDDVIKVVNSSDVIEVAPGALPGYAAASLSFGFTADDTGRLQGLVSNDASGFGNHFNAYLQDGKLNVRFQTDEGREVVLTKSGIASGQDYDVNITTNGNTVALFVDGVEEHEVKLAWSWADTDQYLQIGANGWASKDGSGGYDGVFKGIISDFAFKEIAAVEPEPDTPIMPDIAPETASASVFAGILAMLLNLFHDKSDDTDNQSVAKAAAPLATADATDEAGAGSVQEVALDLTQDIQDEFVF